MAQITKEQQTKIDELSTKLGLTPETITENLNALYKKSKYVELTEEEANKYINTLKNTCSKKGITLEEQKKEVVKITNSNVSNKDVEKNPMTEYLFNNLSTHKGFPKDFNMNKFIMNVYAYMKDIDVSKIPKDRIKTEVLEGALKGAYLGLDFFNGECYLIPFDGHLQFMSDYKGERKLAMKYATQRIIEMDAKVVRKGDEYQVGIKDGKTYIDYKPLRFNKNEVEGAFAYAKFEDGSYQYSEMSIDEINDIKNKYSKSAKYDSSPWKLRPEEMYKKTVMNNLCKNITKDFENANQIESYENGMDSELPKVEDKPIIDISGEVVDV